MDRRTVFLASVGALSVVACGGEPEEAYGELQQELLLSPSLLIKSLAYSGTTVGSLMRLTVVVLAELYLGTITLAKGAPGLRTVGTFKKGAPKGPGSADVTIRAELFDLIVQEASGHRLSIELEYTRQGAVTEVFIELA